MNRPIDRIQFRYALPVEPWNDFGASIDPVSKSVETDRPFVRISSTVSNVANPIICGPYAPLL